MKSFLIANIAAYIHFMIQNHPLEENWDFSSKSKGIKNFFREEPTRERFNNQYTEESNSQNTATKENLTTNDVENDANIQEPYLNSI